VEYAISHVAVQVVSSSINSIRTCKLMKEHVRFCVCGTANLVEANFCSSCGLQMGAAYRASHHAKIAQEYTKGRASNNSMARSMLMK